MLDDARLPAAADQQAAGVLSARLVEGCIALRDSVRWMLGAHTGPGEVYAGAVTYLELWGTVCGGGMHLLRLQGARRDGVSPEQGEATAQAAAFYAHHVLVHAPALAASIALGADSVLEFPDSAWFD